MAFVTHTLPVSRPTPPQPRRQIPKASGQISVPRRRRLYEFTRETPTPNKPISTVTSSQVHPQLFLLADLSAQRATAITAIAQRLAARDQAIAKDATQKSQQWFAVLDKLRTPPLPQPKIAEETHEETAEDVEHSEDTVESKVDVAADEAPNNTPEHSVLVEPEEEEVKKATEDTETGNAHDSPRDDVTNEVNSDSVRELYTPPSVERPSADFSAASDALRDVVGAAGSAVQSAFGKLTDDEKAEKEQDDMIQNMFKDIKDQLGDDLSMLDNDATKEQTESFKEKVDSVLKTAAEKAEKSVETVVSESGIVDEGNFSDEEKEKKTIGKKLLDAIVDGVESKSDDSTEDEDPVDKTFVNDLVKSGKIKNLTVTKLRRILSANGLKTSGRKSELIARLTSFANSKQTSK